MINTILDKYSSLYGFCEYDIIKDKLINCRAKNRIPETPKTVIVFLYPYLFDEKLYIGSNISKYACVKDYHLVINDIQGKIIKELCERYPDNSFESFSDNSPVPEVYAAMKAGLGVIGKNGLLINKEYGSYVFIGEIITDLKIESKEINFECCIGCNSCLKHCPGKALTNDGLIISDCLSDISQRKGNISEDNILLMQKHNCLWGCDVCQDVCPLNKSVKLNPLEEFKVGFENKMRYSGDISDRAYAWRGLEVVKRNCNIERMK